MRKSKNIKEKQMCCNIGKNLPGLLFLIALYFTGCAAPCNDIQDNYDKYPVMLYISSQNGEIDPVNIIVIMDQDTIVKRDFYCKDGHNWSEFKMNLWTKYHQIRVISENGEAGLDVVFKIDKPLWLTVTYWGKNHFQLGINDQPVIFL